LDAFGIKAIYSVRDFDEYLIMTNFVKTPAIYLVMAKTGEVIRRLILKQRAAMGCTLDPPLYAHEELKIPL